MPRDVVGFLSDSDVIDACGRNVERERHAVARLAGGKHHADTIRESGVKELGEGMGPS